MPFAYYLFKEAQSITGTLLLSAPPPNCQISSESLVLISTVLPTEEEEKLSDIEVLTSSESLSSQDSSSEISDISDMTPDNVTEVVNDVIKVVDDVIKVVDDITKVINEDDEAISSDNESNEIAVTPTSIRTKASCKKRERDDPQPQTPPRTSQSMNTMRSLSVPIIWNAISGTFT
ncbi:hypothetical protein K440DRAFT_643436 [Wilcoxina mikolae CBS 423.85]|nr:hypothetical protein K440DRAFT_643436 [Wilcoxina mikolae CBS 423.85]